MLEQDLHIHTTFSLSDISVVPEQTVALVASVKHAKIAGISDHFENLVNGNFDNYVKEVRQAGLKLGAEVDGNFWADEAASFPLDYYIFHCRDIEEDYASIELLLNTDKPVIIAHPNAFNTDLNRISRECFIEINNRHIWRNDWETYYSPFKDSFKFVISSDAHQPNCLGQAVACHAARKLGIEEHLIFDGY